MRIAAALAVVALLSGCSGEPTLTRTDVFTAPTPSGQDAHMWVADLDPDATTEVHSHPTTRYVYVLEGAIVVEFEGQEPQRYDAGQGYPEPPGVLHTFRNASAARSARALGFEIEGPEIVLAQETDVGVDTRGVTARILFEAPIAGGHIPELVGAYKLRTTEIAIDGGGYVGDHNHLGPGIRQMTEGSMEYL